eukprot:4215447-Amphidinium_carterae.1
MQTVRSDMFAWSATIRAVSQKDAIVEPRLESILQACSATDPELRPKDFSEIAVAWSSHPTCCEPLSNSNRTAVEAVTLLAEEREVWRQCSSSSACSSEDVSYAYYLLSVALLRAAKADVAVKALQKSVVWYPRHAWQPAWLETLGVAYGDLGDAHKQRDYLERALRIEESRCGPEHPEVAKPLANLGNAYGSLGDASKQRDYLERALRIEESHYGEEHPEVAATLANLGVAYGSLGD